MSYLYSFTMRVCLFDMLKLIESPIERYVLLDRENQKPLGSMVIGPS